MDIVELKGSVMLTDTGDERVLHRPDADLITQSIESTAARIDPLHAGARHQVLHHFVPKSEWPDSAIIAGVRS